MPYGLLKAAFEPVPSAEPGQGNEEQTTCARAPLLPSSSSSGSSGSIRRAGARAPARERRRAGCEGGRRRGGAPAERRWSAREGRRVGPPTAVGEARRTGRLRRQGCPPAAGRAAPPAAATARSPGRRAAHEAAQGARAGAS